MNINCYIIWKFRYSFREDKGMWRRKGLLKAPNTPWTMTPDTTYLHQWENTHEEIWWTSEAHKDMTELRTNQINQNTKSPPIGPFPGIKMSIGTPFSNHSRGRPPINRTSTNDNCSTNEWAGFIFICGRNLFRTVVLRLRDVSDEGKRGVTAVLNRHFSPTRPHDSLEIPNYPFLSYGGWNKREKRKNYWSRVFPSHCLCVESTW